MRDFLHALRLMRRNAGFTAVAVLILALGTGANTAIFSLIDTIMLRLLPVRDPSQLVEFLHSIPSEPEHRANGFSWQHYENIRDHNHVFSGVLAASDTRVHIRGGVPGDGIGAEVVDGEYVDGHFFTVLGMNPALGRLIGPRDISPVVVVSWDWWRTRYNFDRAVIGRQIVIEDVPATIIGVAPKGFSGLQVGLRRDIWAPFAMRSGRAPDVKLVARLKSGVSMRQALAEMKVLDRRTPEEQARVMRENPLGREMNLEAEPAGSGLATATRDHYAKPLLVLMAVVGLLLLLSCTNLASMLLARGASRQRELAVRVSLGAGRSQLVRQLLTESMLLSSAGSLVGLLLAYFATGALTRIVSSGRERIQLTVQTDWHVLLFTAGVAVLTGLLFGLAPTLTLTSSAPVFSLPSMGSPGQTKSHRLFGRSLVAVQIAVSLVLLGAAGLFVRHVWDLENVDPGFRRDHLLLVSLDPSRSGYDNRRLASAYRELLARLEKIPGARSATVSAISPLSGVGAARNVSVEGYTAKFGEVRLIQENWIAPEYFATYHTPLLAGRDFNTADQSGPCVAIVNRLMARYYFGDANPIGKHVSFDGDDVPCQIVGVVGDTKYSEISEPVWRTIYFDAFQEGRTPPNQFALLTSVNPAAVAGDVRQTVRAVLKTVAVRQITTMQDQAGATILQERLIATLSAGFAALGAVIAAAGLYGLLAFTVSRRVNEIGVRLALGAARGDVIGMVLRDALWMVLAGLLAGAPLALWGNRLAAHLIGDLPSVNLGPLVFGAAVTCAAALLAALVPALRAAQVEPVEALRCE